MLGIIDWGIGGVSIYKLIREQLGDVPVIYFSDTGVTPYGKMSRKELAGRLDAVIEYLKARGMTHLVIGCNAASTAIPFLKDHNVPIEGMIASGVSASLKVKPKKIGLIGGRRTVLSGSYRNAFADVGQRIHQRIAQPLSGLIESGDLSSDALHAECERILALIKGCSHILLACTHYPAISGVLKQHVSPATKFIDPAPELVKKIKTWKIRGGRDDIFLTTGDAVSMKRSAKAAFSVSLPKVTTIAATL